MNQNLFIFMVSSLVLLSMFLIGFYYKNKKVKGNGKAVNGAPIVKFTRDDSRLIFGLFLSILVFFVLFSYMYFVLENTYYPAIFFIVLAFIAYLFFLIFKKYFKWSYFKVLVITVFTVNTLFWMDMVIKFWIRIIVK